MGALHRTLSLPLIAALLLAAPPTAHARRFTCGSGDRGDEAVDLPWSSPRARVIREAVTAWCAAARGEPARRCRWVTELVARSRCPLEFYERAGRRPAHVALGIHPDRSEWSWYATLVRAPAGWRVVDVFIDDLEHP